MAKSSSSTKSQRRSKALAICAGILLAAVIGWFLQSFKPGMALRQRSYDSLLIARGEVHAEEAAIVYLNERSHTVLNQPHNRAWSRKLHAQLVDRLTRAGAKAIVFDVVFSDSDPAEDGLLAAAMKRHGKVILAADRTIDPNGGVKYDRACDELFDAAADNGSDERLPDSDLVVRRHTPRNPEEQVSLLSWVTAQAVGAPITTKTNAEFQPRWLNYYGRPNRLIGISYDEVINAPDSTDLRISNKVVFVGAKIQTKFAGDRKDEFPSPFSSFDANPVFMAGVEIQATEFLNLVRGDWLRRLPLSVESLVVILFGALVGGGLIFLRPIPATFAALVTALIAAWICSFIFTRHLVWFPWLILVVQIAIALAWSVLFNSVQLYVQKRLYEFSLGLYLPPKLVAKFASSPAMLKPGAEKQLLTFMFSDIADFTSISEGMDGDELARMMNEYFQPAVTDCVHKTEGTLVKYLGDSIFALWNAPDLQPEHARRACVAALHFRELSKRPVRGRMLHTRIGLHTGVANVGNFGSHERVDYTAIGESVNLASRMEGLNKQLGTDCLISGATKEHIGDHFVTRRIGRFQLKGFEGLVEVYELVGFPAQTTATAPWRDAFEEALNNFEQRNLVFAEMGFRRVLELKADDGPANFYLRRIQELGAQELPAAWATHTIMKEK